MNNDQDSYPFCLQGQGGWFQCWAVVQAGAAVQVLDGTVQVLELLGVATVHWHAITTPAVGATDAVQPHWPPLGDASGHGTPGAEHHHPHVRVVVHLVADPARTYGDNPGECHQDSTVLKTATWV